MISTQSTGTDRGIYSDKYMIYFHLDRTLWGIDKMTDWKTLDLVWVAWV